MREQVLSLIRETRIIAIVRDLPADVLLDLAQALYLGGIRMMEITFRQDRPDTWEDTAAAIARIAEKFGDRLLAGAGTVMSISQVKLAADAGARYIISPNVSDAVIGETRRLDLVSLPGALTPSEIAAAHDMGADIVKVFPAAQLGPGYIKAVRAPLKHIDLMAVGGVDEKNVADYIRAGAVGAGVGGNLVNRSWLEKGRFDDITALAALFIRGASLL